jgi:hypothetical protein
VLCPDGCSFVGLWGRKIFPGAWLSEAMAGVKNGRLDFVKNST